MKVTYALGTMLMNTLQMFSKVSEALKKADATTLKALRQLIIGSYTPTPSTIFVDNIYDVKSWIRPYVSTFQYHSTPHVFRFLKNDRGEIEMVYRLLAGDENNKEWLPEGKPFIIMTEMPPGHPNLLKPENAKNPTPGEMRKDLDHLNSRLTGAEMDWWKSFIEKEQQKRVVWQEMTANEYVEAGETFDISSLCSLRAERQEEEEDEDVLRAEAAILQQLNKEHRPVR